MPAKKKQHSIYNAQNNNLLLVTGRAYPRLANDVAKLLDVSVLKTEIYDFANGEISVQFTEAVRGADVFVFQSFTRPVNKWLIEMFLMVDALKRASAKSITAVLPCFPYARQDKKHRSREPISARLMCDFLKQAGATRIITFDAHSDQLQGFFDGPVDHLSALPLFIKYIRGRINIDNVTVVSPDTGRVKSAEKWSKALNNCPIAFVHKTRDIYKPNSVVAKRVVGDVANRDCIIIDDMIDTAGTVASAAKALNEAGAKSIVVASTHGILSPPAKDRLSADYIKEVIVTDTVKISRRNIFDKLTVISISSLLAPLIKAIFEETSVGNLIEDEIGIDAKKIKLKIIRQGISAKPKKPEMQSEKPQSETGE